MSCEPVPPGVRTAHLIFACSLVFVFDPTDMGDYQIPIGKQTVGRGGMIWYTPCSGIWQTVWLESAPAEHIVKLDLVADMDGTGMLTANQIISC